MLDLETIKLVQRIRNLEVKLEERNFLKRLKPPIFEIDLSIKDYVVLRVLSMHKNLTMSELGERLSINLSTLTRIIDKLVSDGIVTRSNDPDDRRIVRIGLLPKAEKLLKILEKEQTKSIISFIKNLPRQDLRKIVGLLEALVDAITGFPDTKKIA